MKRQFVKFLQLREEFLAAFYWSLVQCALAFELRCVWWFSHPCNTESEHAGTFHWVLSFSAEKNSPTSLFMCAQVNVCQELNILSEVLTRGCFRLWPRPGRRWTWKKTDGVGARREWRVVGGWPVSPYRHTPIAPVPLSPASPSAPCGPLCHVPDAHPDSRNMFLLIWIYWNHNTQHYL